MPPKRRSNLPKYVYPLSGGRYIVHFWESGRRVSKTFRDLQSAMLFWAKCHGDNPTAVTMSQLCDAYCAGRLFLKLSAATQREYLRYIRKIKAAIGHMPPDAVRTVDISRMHEHLGKKSPFQANRFLSTIQQVLKFGRMTGAIDSPNDPCSPVQRFQEKPRDVLVTHDEFDKVLKRAPPNVQVAMLLAAMIGLRPGDILLLRFADFQKDGLIVATSKTGQKMLFEWSDGLRGAHDLARSITPRVREYVVATRHGRQMTYNGFSSAWQRLGAPFQFRDLRAYCASHSDDWRILGHSTRAIFDRVYDRSPRRVKPVG